MIQSMTNIKYISYDQGIQSLKYKHTNYGNAFFINPQKSLNAAFQCILYLKNSVIQQ
jgi:hypothetical protein